MFLIFIQVTLGMVGAAGVVQMLPKYLHNVRFSHRCNLHHFPLNTSWGEVMCCDVTCDGDSNLPSTMVGLLIAPLLIFAIITIVLMLPLSLVEKMLRRVDDVGRADPVKWWLSLYCLNHSCIWANSEKSVFVFKETFVVCFSWSPSIVISRRGNFN